jgi:protein-S-isoprenylcysteine O-methyltransferase Ste14
MEEKRMRLAIKALAWQGAVWFLSLLVLFLPAGTLVWPEGWIFFITFFGFVGWLSIWLLRKNPSLLDERLTLLRRGQPFWDRIWLVAFYLLSLTWLFLQPLEVARWHWSRMPLWMAYVGTAFLFCSLSGIFLTLRENSYASPVARLQFERGHQVISTGLYRHIRHPLYMAASLFYLGVPLLLGSWLGLGFAPMFIGLLALRAVLEERMLQKELPGYESYAEKIKYRFIPRIW